MAVAIEMNFRGATMVAVRRDTRQDGPDTGWVDASGCDLDLGSRRPMTVCASSTSGRRERHMTSSRLRRSAPTRRRRGSPSRRRRASTTFTATSRRPSLNSDRKAEVLPGTCVIGLTPHQRARLRRPPGPPLSLRSIHMFQPDRPGFSTDSAAESAARRVVSRPDHHANQRSRNARAVGTVRALAAHAPPCPRPGNRKL